MTRSKWEQAWTEPPRGSFGWYRSRIEPFIVEAATGEDLPSGIALDVGCGNGQATHVLGARLPLVLGLDFALPALVQASAASDGSHASFGVADACHLPVRAGSASIVVDRGCLHCLSLKSAQQYLTEVARVLTPGGRLALVARTANPLPTLRAAIRSPRWAARRIADRVRPPQSGLAGALRSVDTFRALFPDSLVIERAEIVNAKSDVGWHLRHLHLVARRVED